MHASLFSFRKLNKYIPDDLKERENYLITLPNFNNLDIINTLVVEMLQCSQMARRITD